MAFLGLLVAMPAFAATSLHDVDDVMPITVPTVLASADIPALGAAPAAPVAEAGDDISSMPAPLSSAPVTATSNVPAAMPMGGVPTATATVSGAPLAVPAGTATTIPASVTNVVNDLRNSEKNVSLDDIARAQDALARLDLLLEIEKRINDIEKARDDRKNIGRSSSRGSIGSIPASALSLPMPGSSLPSATARPSPAPSPAPRPQQASIASGGDYKVEQIAGTNGVYRAVISGDSGKSQTVQQGDKLGRWTVQKINATGVTMVSGKDRKVLTVESDGAPVVIRAH